VTPPDMRIFSCFECDHTSPCVFIVSNASSDSTPQFCPIQGEAVWKELVPYDEV